MVFYFQNGSKANDSYRLFWNEFKININGFFFFTKSHNFILFFHQKKFQHSEKSTNDLLFTHTHKYTQIFQNERFLIWWRLERRNALSCFNETVFYLSCSSNWILYFILYTKLRKEIFIANIYPAEVRRQVSVSTSDFRYLIDQHRFTRGISAMALSIKW